MANIAFDVDGVMTNLAKFQLDTGRKYFGEDSVKDPTKYDVKDIFDVSKEEREKYWLKYIWPYCITEEMRKNLSELPKKLKADGHKIYIITGRVHTTEDGIRGKLFRKMLLSWLKKNGFEYDEIIYVNENNSAEEKLNACKENNIDLMIEDKTENIEVIKDVSSVICVNAEYNENADFGDIVRIDNFDNGYEVINSVLEKDNKNFKLLSNEEMDELSQDELKKYYEKMREYYKNRPLDPNLKKQEKTYQVTSKVGIPLFKLVFKPHMFGKENIPKEKKGNIYVSNHLGSLDQFPIISMLGPDSPMHFLAASTLLGLKRALLYTKTGAIFVDRNDPQSRKESKEKMMQILLNGGNVFLFPEGTRNYLREGQAKEIFEKYINDDIPFEDFYEKVKKNKTSQVNYLEELLKNNTITKEEFAKNIYYVDSFLKKLVEDKRIKESDYYENVFLPFKYGAVAMAKETGATIVPFAVNNNYFNSDPLVVRAGKPMKVSVEDDLEEKTSELRDEIKNMVWENTEYEKTLKLRK